MRSKAARTTLTYKGINYPFYKTNRGNWDWENAGFSQADLALGKNSAALALAYFTVRDCAKRASKEFTDTLDEFVDNTDGDVLDVFERLKKANEEIKAEEKKSEPEQQPASSLPAIG